MRGAWRTLVGIALGVALVSCARSANRAHDIPCRDRKPESSDITIVGPEEPGDRLEVTGGVYHVRGRAVAGATVYVYHSDSDGQYSRNGQGYEGPRLCGILRTDAQGQFRIRTVMPGHAEGTPHMHFEVRGKGVHRQGTTLLLDLNRRPDTTSNSPQTPWTPSAHPIFPKSLLPTFPPVTRDSSGVYHGHWDIVVQ